MQIERVNEWMQSVVIEEDLRGRELDLVAAVDPGPRLAVVSDRDTHDALGRRVADALAGHFGVQSMVLDRQPHADAATVQHLTASLDRDISVVIAVGSGTINDLCKMAAQQRGCPQLVFGTAPSMNGYTSANAAITVAGHKLSLPAPAPRGVFLDLRVLAKAPARLIRAGLGDSLCRCTAQADWLLAHLLFDQPYLEAPFTLLAQDEDRLLAEPAALLAGDLAAMRSLARTLVLSGLGMRLCGGSQPASQGEHLLSHYIDMMGGPALPQAFHGEQIGVTALAMARLQETILQRPRPPVMRPSTIRREDVLAHFGPELGESCWRACVPKLLDQAGADRLNERLAGGWDALRARIAGVTRDSAVLSAVLTAAGAPTRAADLGWPEQLFRQAWLHAREIRDRYTFLDFAADSGIANPADTW
jgi:glycerol-1-phosphate dehydrogenase [NAD(P)+]